MIVVVALLAGCARSGATPAGTVQVTAVASAAVVSGAAAVPLPVPSAAPASVVPAPVRSGEAACARGARPLPSVDPSASFDVDDPRQRTQRSLAQQYSPAPRRGGVPAAAVPGAEACIHALKLQLSLRADGARVPDGPAVDAALRAVGLTKIVVGPGSTFAASTGAACIVGTYAATGPAFTIGPEDADGSCR